VTAPRPTGSVSRAFGAAALPVAALLAARYAGGALATLGGPAAGPLLAAAAFAATAVWAAPALGRRLGAAAPAAAGGRPANWALAWGAGPAAAVALLLAATGGVRWLPAPWGSGPVLAAVAAATLGWMEEALLRGAAFGILEARAGRGAALWGAAALGGIAALLCGASPLAALTAGLLGLCWGRLRLRRGAATPAALAHAAWNVVLGPLLGVGGEAVAVGARSLLGAHLGLAWWAGTPGAAQGGLAALLVAALAASAASPARRGEWL